MIDTRDTLYADGTMIPYNRYRNAVTAEPETLSVGELNRALRDLREILYQKDLI